ncbi:hypothetical protein GRF59_03720 [Paenibacillus sp. HJL G12]|uniref:Uncharacterized protein n=1 Tax=Paenibacillus dendrobii TaxID=2691084 RepID=A0A7X3LF72_9BACL|nr:hypothetical protein [Paenibacillus dendrobii]
MEYISYWAASTAPSTIIRSGLRSGWTGMATSPNSSTTIRVVSDDAALLAFPCSGQSS